MRSKRIHETARILSIGVLFVAAILFYLISLVNLQIAGQDYYTMSASVSYRTRTIPIKAQRGEIFDRNGVPLITNTYTYTLQLDSGSFPSSNEAANEMLLSLMDHAPDSFSIPTSPFLVIVSGKDLICTYNETYLPTVYGSRFQKLLREISKNTRYPDGRSVDEIRATDACFLFLARYGLCQEDYETLNYPTDQLLRLLAVRIDMETHNFSSSEPYTLLTDISLETVSVLTELYPRGILVTSVADRKFEYPGIASHILGRVGKIPAQSADYYTEKGYPLNAIVGISGVEAAFEDDLRGIDGVMTIVEDSYGNIVSKTVTTEPVPGNDVYLSIDLNYQIAAEKALKDNIDYIVDKAIAGGEQYTGEDADAGALTMLDVKTGEILAIASYPTYDLSTFSRDYNSLVENPSLPLVNRALYGQYPPGSTFKVGVAVTALMEGILTPNTPLECEGVYSYYAETGFAPSCWIHTEQYHWKNHGVLTISKAIQESCNCFFFETGRLCGINLMNKYSRVFGFGQHTGIELGESTGVLAGPDYREEMGLESWSPGDTCQAAIGQSDNLVTPLQLSVYIATVINGGNRLKATILDRISSFDGSVVRTSEPTILDQIYISGSVQNLIMNAMKNVTDYGSAARVFRNYSINVGGKTGTAQRLTTESAYATFTAFAPFEDPEIVVSCIIERGAAGTDAGFAVRDMFNVYFGLGDNG